MPTVITHAAVPLCIGLGLGSKVIPPRLLFAGIILAMLPDADVLSFKFGIAYGNVFGHRGFTHSLVFAFVVPLLCVLIGRRWFRAGLIRCWLFSESDIFGSSVLPSISLSMFTMASIARFTRSEMLEVLGSDYMLLAESKGISGSALIFKHALRNALIPIITVLAPLIVDLMTGSLVVEKIFAIPGVGSLLVNAIQSNDYNVVIALSFIYSAMYIAIMLVVDILYGIIDPRIRLAKKGD